MSRILPMRQIISFLTFLLVSTSQSTLAATVPATKVASPTSAKSAAVIPVPVPPKLGMPLNCTYGQDCFIQNYMDVDASATSAKDYMCGIRTYEGHTGTDIRLLDEKAMNEGVPVIAAADGIIVDKIDGYDDFKYVNYLNTSKTIPTFPLSDTILKTIFGSELTRPKNIIIDPTIKMKIECGNGVMIQHGDKTIPTNQAYTTQYCHIKNGSIKVEIGQPIKKGDPIGLVGMSGVTEFPHIHIGLKLKGVSTDPFINKTATNTGYNCPYKSPNASVDLSSSFWDKDVSLPYTEVALLNFHVTDKVPNAANARKAVNNVYREDKLTTKPKNLVFWADIMGIQKNDLVTITFTPTNNNIAIFTGNITDTSSTVALKNFTKNYSQYFGYVGKVSPTLKAGEYIATISLTRNGKNILENNPASKLNINVTE